MVVEMYIYTRTGGTEDGLRFSRLAVDRLKISPSSRPMHSPKPLALDIDCVCPIVEKRAVLPHHNVRLTPGVAVYDLSAHLNAVHDIQDAGALLACHAENLPGRRRAENECFAGLRMNANQRVRKASSWRDFRELNIGQMPIEVADDPLEAP